MSTVTKPKVELVSITSISKKISDDLYNDLYNVKIKVQNIEFDFNTDLKLGVLKECKEIFNPEEYNYKSFDYVYSRTPKSRKRRYGD